MIFSFYYTEKVARIVINKNPIMQSIKEVKDDYDIASVNAIIEQNYIIPGYNGLEVDVNDSYAKMNNTKSFNETLLVFNEMVPNLSLDDNIDKVIKKGNSLKQSVALIVNNEKVLKYLVNKNYKINSLVYLNNYQLDKSVELINGEVYENNYKDLDSILYKIKRNHNLCLLPYNSEEICRDNKKYLVRPSLVLASYNVADVKNKIESGDIIYVSSGARLGDVKVLLQQINFKDLKIIYLSDLISERR